MSIFLPRGIRNNNPGNIRLSRVQFQGQRKEQTDPAFIQFDTPASGLRALMRVLLTYRTKYGLDTVESIINRYAPPHENATDHYAHHVAKRLGVKRRDTIDIRQEKTMIALARAIVLHENGRPPAGYPRDWYHDDLYRTAFDMLFATA